jgi:hypothetical protein
MANRSDFDSATLPRYLKRMMGMKDFKDSHERGAWKRAFIEAHAIHKAAKNKKRMTDNSSKEESTEST